MQDNEDKDTSTNDGQIVHENSKKIPVGAKLFASIQTGPGAIQPRGGGVKAARAWR